MDKSTDELYEISLRREVELPDVVHLTHLTTPESIYHLRLGFVSLASKPYTSKWYFSLILACDIVVYDVKLVIWPYFHC